MRTGRTARRGSALVAAVIAGVLLAACGDDDDSSSSDDTAAPVEAPADTATNDTTTPADTGTDDIAAPTEAPADTATVGTGDNAELCALATEMASQESPPTADQLTQYQALAPDETSDAVATAAPPLIAAGEDVVAFYNAYAEDDVEAAVNEINLWENENCGLEHDDTTEVPEGASREVEDGAAQIDVVATDFAFDAPATIEGGSDLVRAHQRRRRGALPGDREAGRGGRPADGDGERGRLGDHWILEHRDRRYGR